ncbi:MAG TPA: DNA polymerase III subunit delta [Acidobacteriota bacterium]|nr:DNA polymerase III subunit delta [Acidobacteriota bacterium]
MPVDPSPEYVLGQLERRELAPFYLFYGENEFHLEKALNKIRETFIPEEARDLNLHIFYGDQKADAVDTIASINDAARSLPFMSQNRLIIVRRTESFSAAALESFIPYLDRPVEITCLIFVSSKPDFKRKFYRKIRESGGAVNFRKLNDNEVIPWIKKAAKDLGLDMDGQACAYLQQIVGNRLIDLYSELEKFSLRHGNMPVGVNQIKELAIYSRIYTIFELMDEVSFKRCAASLSVLKRFLEEEGKNGILRVIGMLNRQIRLLWQAKFIIKGSGGTPEVAKKLHLPISLARKIIKQSDTWSLDNLENAFHLLYQADGLLKSGAQGHLVLENVVLSLCR